MTGIPDMYMNSLVQWLLSKLTEVNGPLIYIQGY